MNRSTVPGYAGKILRVELGDSTTTSEQLDEATLRKWLGGTPLGVMYLYDEVPPGVEWDSPENRLIIASGPMGGTQIMGSGTISVVTKGPMTNGATSSQANGFLGAYMKFSGFDAVIFQGRSPEWVYLYLHDGIAELRPAAHLLGLDTWDLQDAITKELGKGRRALTVFGIGPAGENLVRFAAIAGDYGHVAGHNGTGAVMGSKRVKAIVAERSGSLAVFDQEAVKVARKRIIDAILANPMGNNTYNWGTSNMYVAMVKSGRLPVKNYTTNLFESPEPFQGEIYRKEFEIKPAPCWACQTKHLHHVKLTTGPYAGFVGEEPEYEQWAAWGAATGNANVGGAVLLSNLVDRLGMENNETAWVIGWTMECYQKGLITAEDLGGLDLTWGNVEATRRLMEMIARREGIGDLLAEGVMRAARRWGKGTEEFAIHTMKGASPRGHDHRAMWNEMVDTCFSSSSTFEVGMVANQTEHGLPASGDPFSWEYVAEVLGKTYGRMHFEDALATCRFCMRCDLSTTVQALQAVTGWEFSSEEAMDVGRRTGNLMRAFNIRHGIGPETERPSARYGSTPVDGPLQGKSIAPHWDDLRRKYFQMLGWDIETGRPLPETLEALGIGSVARDLWPE